MKNETIQIGDAEVQQLQSLSNENPVAQVIFTEWANRRRNRNFVDVSRFRRDLHKQGKVRDVGAFYTTLKELEKRGFGHLAKQRFFLKANLISLGRAAIEGTKETAMPKKIQRVLKKRVGRPRKIQQTSIVYAVRPGVMLTFPSKLSPDEAIKLIGFIQTLL